MTTKLKLVHSGNPARKALLDEVMNEVFHRMPFGHSFELADGRSCRVVKMTIPHPAHDDDRTSHFLFAVFVVGENDDEPELIRFSVFADHEADEADREDISETAGNA